MAGFFMAISLTREMTDSSRTLGARRMHVLQLGFLVQDVLARLGVELQELELLGRRLLVLVGRVEVAGTGR